MKKLLLLLSMILFVLLQTGCSDSQITEKASGSAESISLTAATKEASKVAQWPKEEWSVSFPEEQGIDSAMLTKADERIIENYPNIYSFLVVRNGFLIYEKYYEGMNKDSFNPVYSITKSVTSALTGIAIKENILQDTNQKVSELIPDYFASIDDEKKKEITLENVLTMTGGLESIDSDYFKFFSSPDWLEFALKKPLIDAPGEKFVYNTGLTQLLSGVITEKAKMSTKEFAEKYLFGPLHINIRRWDCDSKNCYGGGSGLYLTPQDMAKFGYLYLNKGKWDGNQIIPEEWVTESTTAHINREPDSDYGYLFWIYKTTNPVTGKSYDTYSAEGAGGQKIIVIPELELIVVITADMNKTSLDKADNKLLVENFVLPGLK